MLVLSKNNHGLIIYSSSCKSHINILKTVYHQSFTASTYAHRITTVNNTIAAVDFTDLENRPYGLRTKIITKFLNSNKSAAGEDVKKANIGKKTKRSAPEIDYCLYVFEYLPTKLKGISPLNLRDFWKVMLVTCPFLHAKRNILGITSVII